MRHPEFARGLALALAPLLPAIHAGLWLQEVTPWRYAAWGAAVVTVLAGLWPRTSGSARLMVLGLMIHAASVAPALLSDPLATFGYAVAGGSILLLSWSSNELPDGWSAFRGALLPALGAWFATGPARLMVEQTDILAVYATVSVATYFAARAVSLGALRILVRAGAAVLLVAGAILAVYWQSNPAWSISSFLVAPLAARFLVRTTSAVLVGPTESGWTWVANHPARLVVGTFAAIAFFGSVLLWLPVSSATGHHVPFVDAAFTAVSATCVTGLSTLDTPNAYSFAGQTILLLLIQVGGLGIMTFSTAALALLGRRTSLQHERAIAGIVGAEGQRAVVTAVVRMLVMTFVVEVIGAVILCYLFRSHGMAWGPALWNGLFTAISAFCNAGFALFSDSLVSFQQQPLVLHTVGLLILLGSLGPATVVALPRLLRRKPVSVEVWLVSTTSLVLLVVPAFLIAAMEWNGSLGHLGLADRLHNAWFQSVTLRTAGFNSVDFGGLASATVLVMIACMFIGGASGSTAGGIKVTTLAVLILSIVATVRGATESIVRGKRIGLGTVQKAGAITTMGVLSVFAAALLILLTQDLDFITTVFEVVSALGTVGLTIGGTGQLDTLGKLIIMGCMFAGRVGPVTLFLLLSEQGVERRWKYPAEEVPVG